MTQTFLAFSAFDDVGYRFGTAARTARRAVRLAARLGSGPESPAAAWLFGDRPVQVPAPRRRVLDGWLDDWMRLDDGTGRRTPSRLDGLRDRGTAFAGSSLAPMLGEIVRTAARAPGPVLAVVVLDGYSRDGDDVLDVLGRSAGLPLFWAFLPSGDGTFLRYDHVLRTLGRGPESPPNAVLLSPGGRLAHRRLRSAYGSWQRTHGGGRHGGRHTATTVTS